MFEFRSLLFLLLCAFCFASIAKVSEPAPDWTATAVINLDFKEISLSDYAGRYLVILFYPLDFTFVCPTEVLAFNDRMKDFEAINTAVVAVSVDSHFVHHAWVRTPRKEGGLGNDPTAIEVRECTNLNVRANYSKVKLPLISDLSHNMSKAYGVYLEGAGHSLRGLFIIDKKQILRQSTINDIPVGRSVDETLRLIQAFQHTDMYGDVCPAEWRPGSDTIDPHPDHKLKYFKKKNDL